MNHDQYPDSYILGVLNTVKTIAMVGVSPKDNRPSYFAFKYLLDRGYHMIPVNPGQAGQEILGQKVYAKLSDIPESVDMVDIFRASEHVMQVVMNRCPKIEYGRLSSEISWIGVNSRTLSSRRAQSLGKGVQRMRIGPGAPNKHSKN
jgi:predicted CoA-binding protein